MTRLAPMLNRLPPTLRADGRGLLAQYLAVPDAEMARYDEDMDRVRRSHFVDTAFNRVDVARLGALFDMAPADWEPTALFRIRLIRTITARLKGAVTRTPLDELMAAMLDAAQQALGTRYGDPSPGAGRRVFRDPAAAPRQGAPVFREFPPRRVRDKTLMERGGRMRPLDRITLTNRGLFAAPLEGIVRGLRGGRTAVPMLSNLRTGRVVVYRGVVPSGGELRLSVVGDALTATLDDHDVSDRLMTATGFVPGAVLPLPTEPAPRPILLEPGVNEIWFLPLALYGERILDRAALAMPGLEVKLGVFGAPGALGTDFDTSLFEEPASAALDLFWQEATPASFRFEVPAGAVRRDASETGDRLAERAALLGTMQDTLRQLRAAGTDGQVLFAAIAETQVQRDRGQAINPFLPPDTQPSESRLAGVTAIFDETAREGGRFA
jgi:hypothetical protein